MPLTSRIIDPNLSNSDQELRECLARALSLTGVYASGDVLSQQVPTVREISPRFLVWVQETNSIVDKSKECYRGGCRLLLDTSIADIRMDLVTNELVEELKVPGSPWNTNRARSTLSRILHKAEEWKLIGRPAKIKILKLKGRTTRLDAVSERKLMEAAESCAWRFKDSLKRLAQVLGLARETGVRNVKELYPLRVEQVDFDRNLISIRDSKTPAGIRDVPMSNRAIEVLQDLCGNRTEGWVFPSKRSKSGHLTTMAKMFRAARDKAGIPKSMVIYCARHDFGTRLLEWTKDLKLVMEIMGHVDVRTAMNYQHPDHEKARRALNETK